MRGQPAACSQGRISAHTFPIKPRHKRKSSSARRNGYPARASPFKAALQAALPKPGRKRAAADRLAHHVSRSLARSHGDSDESVTKRRTRIWSVRTPTAVQSRRQRAGRKRARVLKMSDRCHCGYDSYTRVRWKGNPAEQGDTCLAEENVQSETGHASCSNWGLDVTVSTQSSI